MKESRWWFKHASNLKDDQLEESETEGECDGKYELNADVFDLIVLEELFHEENKTATEEKNLK